MIPSFEMSGPASIFMSLISYLL